MFKVDKVSEILNVHTKTVRRYIKEGKLNAKKAGGQWRISEDDILDFLGERPSYEKKDEIIDSNIKKMTMQVSSIVDIDSCTKEEADRITATVCAAMNSKIPENKKARCDSVYKKKEKRLRIMLWGSSKFIGNMLEMISEIMK
ncbi:MAG: helix-turn-helix domain-containing protein [Desulfobacterales bacterium]|nr:helix-turn-helix domain-containing protein [Desulfobacterales bacterium]MCP4158906.1 helix-turn-helix domain-containing protein [Deltaproteobacteria bacterium]